MGVNKQVAEAFDKFLDTLSADSLVAVHELLTAQPEYSPYAGYLERVEELIHKGDNDAAAKVLKDAWPTVLLSPLAHFLGCILAKRHGDDELGKFEVFTASVCLGALMSTGDGSREHPYLVTLISDEYDILATLKKEVAEQGLVSEDGRQLDRIRTTDGAEIWFNVTAPLEALRKRMEKKAD